MLRKSYILLFIIVKVKMVVVDEEDRMILALHFSFAHLIYSGKFLSSNFMLIFQLLCDSDGSRNLHLNLLLGEEIVYGKNEIIFHLCSGYRSSQVDF